jgi:DNA-binding NarL/FixJ family response regulator
LALTLPFGKVPPGLGDPMEDSGATVNGITPREREVLLELCRPAATHELFVEPASVRDIAHALAVTEAAVKQHLLNLYGKFGIAEGHERRRVALAREALRSGVIGLPDLPVHRTEQVGAS